MAQLEELIESYRTFVSNATLGRHSDEVTRRKLLKKTQKIVGPPPDAPENGSDTPVSKTSAYPAHILSNCMPSVVEYGHVE
jgi:hypothetical protein